MTNFLLGSLRWYPTRLLCAAVVLFSLTSCGGGGNATSPTGGDFDLSVSPASQSLTAGSSTSVSLLASAVNGFSAQVTIQVSGVPPGVSISPTSITLQPGASQKVSFTAAKDAASANATVTFTGTSGSLSHAATLSLAVSSLPGSGPGRTRYVRTDATTEYFGWVNTHWIVFNSPTSRFFVTDPILGHIYVFDSVSETEIGVISVPGAYGIGDSLDHKTLYVGTLIGDVYTIDPAAMAITKRYLASQIGPYGYSGLIALGLANGSIALLGSPGGIPNVDGSGSFAVWNPVSNAISIYASQDGSFTLPPGVPFTVVCGPLLNIAGFTLTADRSKIIVGSIDSDATLCQLDGTSGANIYATAHGWPLFNIIPSPDGKYLIFPDGGYAGVYNAQTLANVAEISVPTLNLATDTGFAVSADSSTLFFPDDTDNIVYAYSLETHLQIGWFPTVYVPPISGGIDVGPVFTPFLLAVDDTGLFAGPMEEGVGLVDSATMQTGPVGTKFTNGLLDNPVSGLVSGGTQIQWTDGNEVGPLAGVYLGTRPASDVSASSPTTIQATTPAGSAGPADVYAFTTDGGMQLIPEGFSYGPTILEVTPDQATQEGGGTGMIYGYGLGPMSSNAIPAGLQVTVGGKAVRITGYASPAYPTDMPPFPLEQVLYDIPAGTSGSSVDVTVTTAAGQATAHSAFSYLPAIQQFPLSGAALAQGTYDPLSDLYYFTDTNKGNYLLDSPTAWGYYALDGERHEPRTKELARSHPVLLES